MVSIGSYDVKPLRKGYLDKNAQNLLRDCRIQHDPNFSQEMPRLQVVARYKFRHRQNVLLFIDRLLRTP